MSMIGCARNTLVKWMKICEMTSETHPDDKRLRLITAGQIEEIRQRMEARGSYITPKKTPNPPALPPALSESHRSVSGGHSVRRASSNLPDGWVTYKQMCLQHGISERTADRAIEKGIISITTGEYRVGTADTKKAMSPEQQTAFLAWLQSRG